MQCPEVREENRGTVYQSSGESSTCQAADDTVEFLTGSGGSIMALEGWAVALIVIGSILTIVALMSFVYYWCVLRYRVADTSVSMAGKTIVITGASSGIGKATALALARRGARLILACRNEQKTAQVISEIKQAVPDGAEILYRHLDLVSLKSVRSFAERIIREESKLDILINNAGIGQKGRTEDGFDLMFGVNHFGPFLLTNLLLDLLRKSAPSRVVNLSSLAHRFSPAFDFTEFDKDDDSSAGGAVRYLRLASYPISKMAVNLFTRELGRRLADDSQVTVCSVHPGIVYTGAIDGALRRGSCRKLLIPLFRFLMRTPEAGAQCVIHCAIDESVRQHSGDYFVDCRPGNEGAMASDEALAKQLWEVSCQATGL
ncbi:retinol dehydrogenase 11-like [Acanthaster planci]|uniref:Retinol dehydrogenase 11-like n=1 Tax=Acanthaster planci TaxID=133434 RepID=A0A8B7ZES0_ACAPL|nr:retinol dehydrogenase 11-like [Acanthaster planci]